MRSCNTQSFLYLTIEYKCFLTIEYKCYLKKTTWLFFHWLFNCSATTPWDKNNSDLPEPRFSRMFHWKEHIFNLQHPGHSEGNYLLCSWKGLELDFS